MLTGIDKYKKNGKEVTNLSKVKLSKYELSLLSKGLKFVPTRRNIDLGKLISDLKTWERRMRLKEYFYSEENENNENTEDRRFKKKSTWTPKEGRDKWLDLYIQSVKDDIINGLRRDFKMNVSKAEEKAMRDLLNNDNIVIRPADKGSGIVILDADQYKEELFNEMDDNKTYQKINKDPTQTIRNKVKKLVTDMYKRGSINEDLKKYMLPSDCGAGKLQANPKLHKNNMPVRTIVNGRNHPTARMAEVVEDQLTENVKSLGSYIQDTTDFLNKISQIEQPLPDNSIMFCMDVKSLYPSVPRKEARMAVKRALDKRMSKEIPSEEVLNMMDLVLDNNNFTFAGEHFIQKEGTAIGSHLGMNYASTYLGEWEHALFENSDNLPIYHFRYVDDIWGVWTKGITELKEFYKTANAIHPCIQVDLRYSSDKIEFLDVLTSIKNNRIETELFTKETDKHLYLHSESSHPESTKRAIPYGLGVRIKRICSDSRSYEKNRLQIKNHLKNRGYHGNFVENELQKVDKLERQNLLSYRNKKKSMERVPLVLTFSKGLPNVRNILRKHMPTLHTSDRLKNVFPTQPILAYKRDNNLQDILVHKKHNKMFFQKPQKCEPCGSNCALCPYLLNSETFTNHRGEIYNVRNYINCKTENVVYAIFCNKCNTFIYVGETGDTLYQRMLLNFSRIRNQTDDPVAKHFYTDGHTVKDFRVQGIEKLCGDDIFRKTHENLWKNKMRTYKPYGINTKE